MQKIKEYNIIFVCPLLNFYDGLPKLQEAEFVFIHLDGRSIYCSFDVYLLSCTVCFWLATKTVTFFYCYYFYFPRIYATWPAWGFSFYLLLSMKFPCFLPFLCFWPSQIMILIYLYFLLLQVSIFWRCFV